jgi:hypothetical protein
VRETAVIEPAVPVEEEEPKVANMRLSIAISCAERYGPERRRSSPTRRSTAHI